MAKVKGVQVKAIITFLKNRFGEDSVSAAIEGLPAEVRELLPAVLLDSSWYPYDILRPIRGISRAMVPGSGEDFTLDMGKFIAEYTLAGLYRSLLEKDPLKQVEKFSWVHDFFYQDTQKIETTALSKSSCLVRYRYEAGLRPARSSCLCTLGFWMRTIELSGGTNVAGAHTRCVIDGKDSCEFLLEWA
jgi:hypothetical protein